MVIIWQPEELTICCCLLLFFNKFKFKNWKLFFKPIYPASFFLHLYSFLPSCFFFIFFSSIFFFLQGKMWSSYFVMMVKILDRVDRKCLYEWCWKTIVENELTRRRNGWSKSAIQCNFTQNHRNPTISFVQKKSTNVCELFLALVVFWTPCMNSPLPPPHHIFSFLARANYKI